MTESAEPRQMVLPSIRATMGDWIYYAATMSLAEIAVRVSFAQDIHPNSVLRELIQRQLTPRSETISAYLQTQDQRFFNSLVIGIYGGMPEWHSIDLRSRYPDATVLAGEEFDDVFGLLTLSGSETMFAIDGQHRVAGIKKAVDRTPALGDEQVSVLFVGHTNDISGLTRTRRLFTTLNRYAKPVSQYDIIAMDEDDAVAIVTRTLLDEHSLFRDKRISLYRSKNLPPSDKTSLTSIMALYQVNDLLLSIGQRGWPAKKRTRPADDSIAEMGTRASQFWTMLVDHIPEVFEYATNENADASPFRTSAGGHVLFRPAGLLVCARVIQLLISSGRTMDDAVARLAKVPAQLSESPWVGLLWDESGKRMITDAVNQGLAKRVLYVALGGDVRDVRTTPAKLLAEWQALAPLAPDHARLPRYD